jgi:hypothetical protein
LAKLGRFLRPKHFFFRTVNLFSSKSSWRLLYFDSPSPSFVPHGGTTELSNSSFLPRKTRETRPFTGFKVSKYFDFRKLTLKTDTVTNVNLPNDSLPNKSGHFGRILLVPYGYVTGVFGKLARF